ncbi:histone deacetylase family protein [Rhodopila sp.]|uniref:histone deacetylase family protein n=1 Tax=Rhodopila sp. TaxID=2480087 RepID=UPI003D1420AD
MIVITTDHAAHDPDRFTNPGDTRPYWETPARADALLGAVRAAGLATKPCADHGLAPIQRLHDAGYLAFLQTAFSRFQALANTGPILRAPAYAVRHKARRPDAVMGQAGWYLSSVSAPIVAATWSAALGSAHAAIDAADDVISGQRYAYALCRPPGHHAHTDMAGGFCYLNNAAIAAQRMLDRGSGRVAILDFDVHHGNGTQQIFYQRDDVHYVSIHGDPAGLYPWFAGYADETGEGPGLGCNLNLPLPADTGDDGFTAAVEQGLDAIAARRPSALIVSAGFDAQLGDPAANLAVTAAGFATVGRQIAALGLPTVLIQEGGYLVERLAANLTAFLTGLELI